MTKFDPHPGRFQSMEEACRFGYLQLLRQGSPSVLAGRSVLRGLNGKKNFLGHLLRDELHREDLEHLPLTNRPSGLSQVKGSYLDQAHQQGRYFTRLVEAMFVPELTPLDLALLARFNLAHDQAYAPSRQAASWSHSFRSHCLPLFLGNEWDRPILDLQLTE